MSCDRLSKRLRVAVVGCGAQAEANLLPALLQVPRVDVVALCDVDEQRAACAARPFLNAAVFEDFADAIECTSPDAVVLSGPPGMHVQVAHHALGRGIHVFVEKPPARFTHELETLAELAERSGCITVVGHNLRHASPVRVMQRMAGSPEFGSPTHAQIRFVSNKPRGLMWDLQSPLRSMLLALGTHALDFAQFWLGTIEEVAADVRPAGEGLMVSALLRCEQGSALVLTGSCAPALQFGVQVTGTHGGSVRLNDLWMVEGFGIGTRDGCSEWDPGARGVISWTPSPLDSGYARSGYLGELNLFVDAVLDGVPAHPSLREEIGVYRAIDAIERAAEVQHESRQVRRKNMVPARV